MKIATKTIVGVLFIAGILFGAYSINMLYSEPEQKNIEKIESKGKLVIDLGEYTGAGADETTWLEIFAMPHVDNPASVYNDNTTANLEASAYAYADTDGWSDDLIANTAFDIVVRVRYNETHAKDPGGWNQDRTRVNITISGDETESDTNMTIVVTQNNSAFTFFYANYYLSNSGAGYQISSDGTITVDQIKIWAKY